MKTLRARLFIGMTLFILAFGIIAAIAAFRSAFDEADELQDAILVQIAALHLPKEGLAKAARKSGIDKEDWLIVEELGSGTFPATLSDGFHIVEADDLKWRVLVQSESDGRRIAIAQSTILRDETARDAALRTLIPLAALIPCLMIMVALVIRLTFRPLTMLSARVDAQEIDRLERLPDRNLPGELEPFVASINRLLDRLDLVFAQQRRFIADAAHELRSPITALSLQVQNIDSTALPPTQQTRFDELRSGMLRIGRLLEQLLALARYDVRPKAGAAEAALDVVLKAQVAEFLPRAEAHGVDLGFEQLEPLVVRADATALAVLVRNLLDNAIRHTPPGGRVDVSLRPQQGRALLFIDDNGPGLRPEVLSRVFEPFYRGPEAVGEGNGLGLSIVQKIAERFGGTVTLGNIPADEGRAGLRATVSFALAEDRGALSCRTAGAWPERSRRLPPAH
jgi:two-component system OmpR family sensor kinase